MDPRLSKWLRWLDVIKSEVQDLVVAKYTFHSVQAMIAANPRLQVGNSFYRYITSTYISHTVIGIRRQVKIDPQSISLALLLQDIIATPEVVNRKYFVSLYKGSAVEDLANDDFDRFAGRGRDHIDPLQVEEDLKQLCGATTKCEDFADKRLAHRDKRDPKALPTYNEVDGCIDLLDKLYVKYLLLFKANSMETLLPTWQYDWQEIFRIPWIGSKD